MLPAHKAFEFGRGSRSLGSRNDLPNLYLRFSKFVLLILLSVSSIVLASDCISQELTVVNASTEQFNELMRMYPGITVIDIRTPGEFNQHHIRGAKNIDFSAPAFKARLNLMKKGDPLLLHSRSGNRSGQSLAVFEDLGFEKVFHLNQGINGGWPARPFLRNNTPIDRYLPELTINPKLIILSAEKKAWASTRSCQA